HCNCFSHHHFCGNRVFHCRQALLRASNAAAFHRRALSPAFERSLMAICRASADGTIVGMNCACAELLGYKDPSQAIGKKLSAHLPPVEFETSRRKLLETKRLRSHETQLIKAHGEPV